ncbi:MAG: M1 family metallopeptidase [Saprospiraceae bacterium]|nr:M1 family metallopeptidase [Saprospiraceae bacterium]
MLSKFAVVISCFLLCINVLHAQPDRWQQRVDYQMDIDMDVAKHQFKGKQRLKYTNNSPDELDRVFYHLYFNAFQPNSNMDVRSRSLPDPDPRVKDRISKLKSDEQGWHKITSLKMDGKDCKWEVNETILEVELPKGIKPNSTVEFEMEFTSQVPIQVRRSGRNSADGIDYSMAQWYPKLCEYDYQGWHANPYVAREFYGVWGDFDVKITIDRKYCLGASGVLQNGGNIGYGYEPEGTAVKPDRGDKFTWHWKAENVHDFAWSADRDYKHVVYRRKDGLVFHFLYQDKEDTRKTWEAAPLQMDKAFDFVNKNFGQYPYKSYSFLEAGDGGMEYPMATFLAAGAGLGTFIHEAVHAWYYGLLGSNESLYAWMDEGFTEYVTSEVENYLMQEKLMGGTPVENPHLDNNVGMIRFMKSGREEPLSIHSDHYTANAPYSVGAYVKGHVILTQLQYIMGKPVFDKAFKTYFDTWKFKHPNVNDFIRVMEKESGLELDWFKEYFVYTTKTIDYAVKSVGKESRKETKITLERKGLTPMPLDITVTYKDGSKQVYNLPLDLMRGAKKGTEFTGNKYSVLPDWRWTHPTYEFVIEEKLKKVDKVEIDASLRLLDVDRENNVWGKKGDEKEEED